jgi:hypothetical protein
MTSNIKEFYDDLSLKPLVKWNLIMIMELQI